MELDRAVEGVSLDAGARVAEGYRGCGGDHGNAPAEHALVMVSAAMESTASWESAAQRLLAFSLTASACNPATPSHHSRGLRLGSSVHCAQSSTRAARLASLVSIHDGLSYASIQNFRAL